MQSFSEETTNDQKHSALGRFSRTLKLSLPVGYCSLSTSVLPTMSTLTLSTALLGFLGSVLITRCEPLIGLGFSSRAFSHSCWVSLVSIMQSLCSGLTLGFKMDQSSWGFLWLYRSCRYSQWCCWSVSQFPLHSLNCWAEDFIPPNGPVTKEKIGKYLLSSVS